MSTGHEYAEQHREEIESSGTIIERIGNAVAGRLLSHADAATIFGDASTQGDRTVIPVGRVATRYGFGGGSGSGFGEDGAPEGVGGGGGGGSMLEVKPIGYIELTPDDSRFVSIVDGSQIAVRAVTVWGVVALVGIVCLFRYLGGRGD